MKWINRLQPWYQAREEIKESPPMPMAVILGTIQRVNYQRRELRVIAQGQVWEFVLSEDCRLWFDGAPAILRCFHPLDPVTVFFQERETVRVARMIYTWEPQPSEFVGEEDCRCHGQR